MESGCSQVNAKLSEDDVHLNDDKVDYKVDMVEDDLIDVSAVVSQDVDVRVDAEVTRNRDCEFQGCCSS